MLRGGDLQLTPLGAVQPLGEAQRASWVLMRVGEGEERQRGVGQELDLSHPFWQQLGLPGAVRKPQANVHHVAETGM